MRDFDERLCNRCNVALLYPHPNNLLAKDGWFKCELCGYCKIIETQTEKNRTKNQK